MSASGPSPPGARRRSSPSPSAPRSRSPRPLTRIADRPEAVSDEIWEEAARHYDEGALAALLVDIAGINVWNRLNAATRQPAGGSWG